MTPPIQSDGLILRCFVAYPCRFAPLVEPRGEPVFSFRRIGGGDATLSHFAPLCESRIFGEKRIQGLWGAKCPSMSADAVDLCRFDRLVQAERTQDGLTAVLAVAADLTASGILRKRTTHRLDSGCVGKSDFQRRDHRVDCVQSSVPQRCLGNPTQSSQSRMESIRASFCSTRTLGRRNHCVLSGVERETRRVREITWRRICMSQAYTQHDGETRTVSMNELGGN